MKQAAEDAIMGPEKQNNVSAGYILAAAAIWTLVLYSVSSLHRPEPSHMALIALQVCDSGR